MDKQRNPVAKNASKFNKASVQRDRKKDQKRGYKVKHKGKLYASTTEPTGDLKDACWKGYTAVGTKKKNGKTVPNCVPKEDFDNPLADYPEQEKIKTKFVKNEDAIQRAKETARLRQKHDQERKAEKARAKQIKSEDVTEISNKMLSRYKTKAAKSASAADKAGNFKKADKRFSGITRATNKQFKNDAKRESVEEELSAMQKRKHMNLKRRSKAGDRSAVTQLRKFEKDNAADLKKKPRSAKQISKGEGSAQDSNLIVQLRKSQDSGGKHAIEVGPGKKVKLNKKTVDNLLKQYDSMKPDMKRKWQTVATKKLRSMAK